MDTAAMTKIIELMAYSNRVEAPLSPTITKFRKTSSPYPLTSVVKLLTKTIDVFVLLAKKPLKNNILQRFITLKTKNKTKIRCF